MTNQRIPIISKLLQPIIIVVLLTAFLNTNGYGKDHKEPTKTTSAKPNTTTSTTNKPTTNATKQTQKPNTDPHPSNTFEILPKNVNHWFELPHPLVSTKNLGLLNSKTNILNQILSENNKQIQKNLGIDINNKNTLRTTKITIDHPINIT